MEARAKLFGHPIHQMLIVFPLGVLGMSLFFDLIALGTSRPALLEASFYMIAAGIITGLLAAVFGLVLGLEFGGLLIPSLTYLQEHTTDEVRGRIFSLFFLAYNGATAIPILAAAALADAFGTARVIGGLGLLLCLAGAGVARGGVRVYGEEET